MAKRNPKDDSLPAGEDSRADPLEGDGPRVFDGVPGACCPQAAWNTSGT